MTVQLNLFNENFVPMEEKENLEKRLRYLLDTKIEGDSEAKEELLLAKRKNEIETVQLKLLKISLSEIYSEYSKRGVEIDSSYLLEMRKDKHQWLITADGEIIPKSDPRRNVWYDSKTFDAIVPIEIGSKGYTLFFILKGVPNAGGHQDDVKKEIGLYSKQIQKNQDEDYHFIFLLDGAYINKDIDKLDKSDRYDLSTTETVKNTIKNFIDKNLK